MTPPPADPIPSDPGSEKPVAGATSDSNSGVAPKRCATCGTSYSGELCPTCIAGFAEKTGPPVTPFDETVHLGSKTDRRTRSEPAIPEEAANSPATARFGKFIRTKRLGAGGMGEVWKAWDTVLGRWVALKFLKGGDDDEILRFRREAQTSGRLHHPNIAAIFEVDEDQGRHYIAMQFVDGQTLHTFPRDDRRALVKMIACAAQALQYAHEQGVIHRDLKPENLMVTSRPKADGRSIDHHLYVMDFGLARLAEGASKLSVSGFVVGTPSYMSPEQARGEKVDARADVYSLGVTLYEILTGRRPFESENVYETLRRVQEEEPNAPRKIDPRIPADLETIVLKCMSKEPAQRYASAQALADDLFAFNAGEPIQARRESLSRLLVRRVKRHPVAFVASILLALALSVSGIIAASGSRDRRAGEQIRQLSALVRDRKWEQARAVASELASVSPGEAGAYRKEISDAMADAVLQDLAAGNIDPARQTLEQLEAFDAKRGAKVRVEFKLRGSIWPAVFDLKVPFGGATGILGAVRVEAERLSRVDGLPVVLTKKECEGSVELKAEFEPSWKNASEIGLVLNGRANGVGYRFLLSSAAASSVPLPTFVEARRAMFRLRVFRNEALVLDNPIPGAEILGEAEAPLRLMAKRDGDRLTFQVNDRPPAESRDPFAVGMGRGGYFGLLWPLNVGLRRLLASHRESPAEPPPLQKADDLFVQGKYEDALLAYRGAALATESPLLRQEARYKEGLCELQSNRVEEAIRIFQDVVSGFLQAEKGSDLSWLFMADCQLLGHYFRQKNGIDQAQAVLDRLKEYGYQFDQLALLMPQDVQSAILYNNQSGSVGQNLSRTPEEHLARAEFAVQASKLLEPPGRKVDYKWHALMRAQMAAGLTEKAMETARQMFREFGEAGDHLDDYSWMLRLRGKPEEALRMIERGVAKDPSHLVERARIHAALNQWSEAEKDLDAYFKNPKDYHSFSAAALLHGFLLEHRGAPEADIVEAWKRGLMQNFRGTGSEKGLDSLRQGEAPQGMPLMNHWIMASLTGEMSDGDAERLLGGLTAFAGKDNPVFNKLMRPSVLRATWRTPRGREVARQLALRTVPFYDAARYPLFMGWIAFVHEISFPPEPLSAEQEELLWKMSLEIYEAYRSGAITEKYLLPFGVIVQGNPNAPGMGWKEMGKILEKRPRLRGPVGYIFGQRYAKKGDLANARLFYKSALVDAERDGGDPLLRKLAQAEIDRLGSK